MNKTTKLINEMRSILDGGLSKKRLTVENVLITDDFDVDNVESEMNNPGYDGGSTEYDDYPKLPAEEVANITPIINQIRSIVIQGLAKLAEHPDTPQYDTLKKIWQLIDKTVETKQPKDTDVPNK